MVSAEATGEEKDENIMWRYRTSLTMREEFFAPSNGECRV